MCDGLFVKNIRSIAKELHLLKSSAYSNFMHFSIFRVYLVHLVLITVLFSRIAIIFILHIDWVDNYRNEIQVFVNFMVYE